MIPLLEQPQLLNSRPFQQMTQVKPTTNSGYEYYDSTKGRLFLPAGKNYLTNPSFETDTNADGQCDSVSTAGSSITGTPVFTRVEGRNGGYAQRIQYTGVAGDAGGKNLLTFCGTTAVGTYAQNDWACNAVYVKGSLVGGPALYLRNVWKDAAASTVETDLSGSISVSSSWSQVSLVSQAGDASTSRIVAYYAITGIDEGDTVDIYFDDAVLSKDTVLVPYFDGNTTGCTWDGTEDASTTTRAASVLVIPWVKSLDEGTIMMTVNTLYDGDDGDKHVFSQIEASGSSMKQQMFKNAGDEVVGKRYDGSDEVNSVADISAADAGDDIVYAHRWDVGENPGNWLDYGATADSDDASAIDSSETSAIISFNPNATYPAYAYIRNVIVSDDKKDDADVDDQGAGYQAATTRAAMLALLGTGDLFLELKNNGVGYLGM